jgi:hypothetical protein
MNQIHQSTTFNDEVGIYFIKAGNRGAFRDSRAKALLYAYGAVQHGNNPISIVNVGQNERLDAHAILQGWKELDLPLPPLTQGRKP